jgi:hypothetical protein
MSIDDGQDYDDDEIVLEANGDFIFDDRENLRIVGVNKNRNATRGSNTDKLEVTITQYGNEPHDQKFVIQGGSLEIPAFERFIGQLAARMALLRKHGQ